MEAQSGTGFLAYDEVALKPIILNAFILALLMHMAYFAYFMSIEFKFKKFNLSYYAKSIIKMLSQNTDT